MDNNISVTLKGLGTLSLLFTHAHAKIFHFSISQHGLPVRERLLASGQVKLIHASAINTIFLKLGPITHPILNRSRCWRIDNDFILPAVRSFFRLELLCDEEAASRLAAQLTTLTRLNSNPLPYDASKAISEQSRRPPGTPEVIIRKVSGVKDLMAKYSTEGYTLPATPISPQSEPLLEDQLLDDSIPVMRFTPDMLDRIDRGIGEDRSRRPLVRDLFDTSSSSDCHTQDQNVDNEMAADTQDVEENRELSSLEEDLLPASTLRDLEHHSRNLRHLNQSMDTSEWDAVVDELDRKNLSIARRLHAHPPRRPMTLLYWTAEVVYGLSHMMSTSIRSIVSESPSPHERVDSDDLLDYDLDGAINADITHFYDKLIQSLATIGRASSVASHCLLREMFPDYE